ncbi:MAG: hypothetical protein ACE5GX_07395 [Thermoanaerobaculia bacterium]
MIRIVVGFFKAIGTLPKPWWGWIGLLMLVNMILPFLFIDRIEARVVLAAFLVAAAIQMAMFRALGFVRLLGLGHLIAWGPLEIWLVLRLGEIGLDGLLGLWLATVVAVNGISLVIDIVDVVRFLGGEREPGYVL